MKVKTSVVHYNGLCIKFLIILIDFDFDVHLDLFETGVAEPSVSVSVHQHEPAASTFHVPSSGNTPGPESAT